MHGWLHDFDIVNYLVYSLSHYTMDERRSFKSLDAYNYFVNGWLHSAKWLLLQKSAKWLLLQKSAKWRLLQNSGILHCES